LNNTSPRIEAQIVGAVNGIVKDDITCTLAVDRDISARVTGALKVILF
jgi:hypothetical protein